MPHLCVQQAHHVSVASSLPLRAHTLNSFTLNWDLYLLRRMQEWQ